MTAELSPEGALASFVAHGDAAPPAARERARILLADAMVLAAAAPDVPGFTAVHELGAGAGEHLSWASLARLGPADAVHANACAVHLRFQDDTDMSTWSHPASFVLPAAVVAAVESDGTFGRLLDAIIAGYSATRWLGADGEISERMKSRGFRPSPVFAPLGAAAATSRALGLDAERTEHALNAAAIIGRGTLHSVGAGGDDWRLHNAAAARDGFTLALAAQRGMVAGARALTAENGFLRTVTGSTRVPEAWRIAPHARLIEGVWQKALPVLGDDMAVAVAARELGGRAAGRNIGRVRVRMNAAYARFPGTQRKPPYTGATARQASVRFVAAHLLLHGDLRYADLVSGADPTVDELAERIEVTGCDVPYEDALVEAEIGGEWAAQWAHDLPRTLFWRDRAEQRDRAGHVLGARGVALAESVLAADDEAPVQEVLERALG